MICFELLAKPLTKKSVLIPQIRKFSHHNEGPSFIIKQRITEGQIKADPRQTAVISSLQELYENIKNYSPGKFLATRAPKGLYIFGSVGTGKTMLMDIFYHSVKVPSVSIYSFICMKIKFSK